MKKIFKTLFVLMAFFLILSPVQAKNVDHFYGKLAGDFTLDDDVNGSAAIAGSDVTIKSNITGIGFEAGNKVQFSGNSEYLTTAGNSIEINGIVSRDAIIAGNLISIKKDAEIGRDVVIAGSDVEINGDIERNVSIYASTVSFKGATIKGNVKLYASSVSVDKDTVISGKLSYPSDAETKINKQAKIGNIVKTDPIQDEKSNSFTNEFILQLKSFLSLVLIFALLSLFMPNKFKEIEEKYNKLDFNNGVETFTKGLVFLIVVPLAIVVLFAITIGIPLALILGALYLIILYLSNVFAAYLLGYKLWQNFFNKDVNILIIGILGLAILFILSLIPGIKVLVSVFALLIGIGIIYDIFISRK